MFLALLLLKSYRDPLALVWGEPLCLMWPVRQVEDGDHAKNNRRQSLEDEEPPPASQT